MQSQVHKWGNSLGLRIPARLAKQLQLHDGSKVSIEVEDGKLIVQAPHYDLEAMCKQITPQNQHHLFFDETSRGKEEW